MDLPVGVLTVRRAEHVAAGNDDALDLLDQVFPPRTDDPAGTLAMPAIELAANTAVRVALAARTSTADRRWWMEGFLSGFAGHTAEVLRHAAALCDYTVAERLADMAAHVLPTLTDDLAAASEVVFALVGAVDAEDPVAYAWALEGLWHPVPDPEADHASLARRYKQLLIAAVNTTCASWALRIGLAEHA